MIAAAWLLSLPFRLLAALGLRRSVILACLFALAVAAYGVAEDLGLIDPPARQRRPPSRPRAPAQPNRAAAALSRPATCACTARPGRATESPGRCWPPSARSSPTTAVSGSPGCARAAIGPRPVGRCDRLWPVQQGLNRLAPLRPGPPPRPGPPSRPRPASWSTMAPAATWIGRCSPTTTLGPTSPGSSGWPAPMPVAGDDRRPMSPRRGRSRPGQAGHPPLPTACSWPPSTSSPPSEPAGSCRPRWNAYARTGHRPTWLSPELLAVLEARGRLVEGWSTCCTSTAPSGT